MGLHLYIPLIYVVGNGYITTAVLKEILRELDDTLSNDDLDAMIEGEDYGFLDIFQIIIAINFAPTLNTWNEIFIEIDSDGSGTVDFDGERNIPLMSPRSNLNLYIFFLHIFANRIHGGRSLHRPSFQHKL